MKSYAVESERSPRRNERISFESASTAVHVQAVAPALHRGSRLNGRRASYMELAAIENIALILSNHQRQSRDFGRKVA
jgi:hypothetical protein